jgi:hypothetical protein
MMIEHEEIFTNGDACMCRARWVASALCWLAMAACSGARPPGADAGRCDLEVQWGRVEAAQFVPFRNGEEAELTLGFQGFLFIESAVKVRGTSDRIVDLTFQVTVQGQDARTQEVRKDLFPAADGSAQASEVLVFFNDVPRADLLGRTTSILVQAQVGNCSGRSSVSVTLVDKQACTAPEDGGLICTDGGV